MVGRYARRSAAMQRQLRAEARTIGKDGVAALQHYAPEKTGLFKKGIRYRTGEFSVGVTTTFYASGPHAFVLPFLVDGTKEHEIPIGGSAAQMAKGYPLSFINRFGERQRSWSVWHPGTQPSPFIALAMEAIEPNVWEAGTRLGRSVVWVT